MFSGQFNTDDPIVQTLESQGIRRLYPNGANFDRKQELKKMNHSVAANFLDLVELLIRCPSSPERERKIEDLNLLFINFHHLINEYRPQQAVETLKLMLEIQLRQRRALVRRFQNIMDALATKLVDCLDGIPDNLEINFTKDSALMQIWRDCFEPKEKPITCGDRMAVETKCAADKGDLLLCKLADELMPQ